MYKEFCILIFCSTEEDCYLCSKFVGKELYKESASWISVAADELIVICSNFWQTSTGDICILGTEFCCCYRLSGGWRAHNCVWVSLRFTPLKVQMLKRRIWISFFLLHHLAKADMFKVLWSHENSSFRTLLPENQISFKKDWPPKWMWISKQSSTEISWIQFQKRHPKSWTLNNPKNPKP